MPQIFHHSTNTISRVSIFGAVFFVAAFFGVAALLDRSSYWTGQTQVLEQPVPFSHDHHVAAIGIDCRYCHTAVEEAAYAGVPPTETCMSCHSQIWADSPLLEPVRESYRTGQPLRWSRIHDLPDFVYFDHSIHVAKGVGCVECHGRVDRMPLMLKAETMQMEWCLSCHRDPAPRLRPQSEIFNMAWRPSDAQAESENQLPPEEHFSNMIGCSTCHR